MLPGCLLTPMSVKPPNKASGAAPKQAAADILRFVFDGNGYFTANTTYSNPSGQIKPGLFQAPTKYLQIEYLR